MEMFDALSSIKDALIPILWFEEGIDELGDDIIDVLKGAAVEPDQWHQYILYCLMGLVSTMTILCLVALGKLLDHFQIKLEELLCGTSTRDLHNLPFLKS